MSADLQANKGSHRQFVWLCIKNVSLLCWLWWCQLSIPRCRRCRYCCRTMCVIQMMFIPLDYLILFLFRLVLKLFSKIEFSTQIYGLWYLDRTLKWIRITRFFFVLFKSWPPCFTRRFVVFVRVFDSPSTFDVAHTILLYWSRSLAAHTQTATAAPPLVTHRHRRMPCYVFIEIISIFGGLRNKWYTIYRRSAISDLFACVREKRCARVFSLRFASKSSFISFFDLINFHRIEAQ